MDELVLEQQVFRRIACNSQLGEGDQIGLQGARRLDVLDYLPGVAIQVTDGTYTSAPATVGFTVGERAGNATPVAAFVETNMAEIGTTPGCATDAYGVCTSCDPCEPTYSLDATASTDADEDLLWYVFSGQKVSGDGGTLEITANGDGTASVSFSMSVGCAPDSSTGLYEVEVEVHDCNGVTDTAAVQIAYTCQSQ